MTTLSDRETTCRRLLLIADKLDKVDESKFNFAYYFSRNGSCLVGYEWNINECGSAACALGFATTIPEIRDAGLTAKDISMGMAQRVLGISYEELNYLFYPGEGNAYNNCPLPTSATSKEVSAHIRNFVAELQNRPK
jgi:hypothetical protein